MKVAMPGPASGETLADPISAATPEWAMESSQGPWPEQPAIQIEPGAVVEA
jgi:hypothetical protein